jgi:hypothetical protein
MKMKNKIKDSKAKFEEWWEVREEYFTKQFEKNIAQPRTDKIILRYQLEVYQKQIIDCICRNPTSIEVSSQDEEIE